MTDGNGTQGSIPACLHDLAGQPFDGARALPTEIYTSPEILKLEEEHLFGREWVCAGRAEALAKRGDYLTFELAGQPIAVLRDNKDQIRAYSNVCLHRMSTLLQGRGNCHMVVCPYHAWTYGLDGKLRNAPHMDKSPDFEPKNYRLPEIRSEIWEGWIYVTLNPDIAPVAERLSSLTEKVTGRYRMDGYVETFREEHVWNTNWKVLAENFMESYHLFALHRATVGPFSKVDEMDCPEGEATFNYHWITKESSLAIGNAHPDNDYLDGDWRRTTALITIYPSHMITLTPGYFWYLVLRPRGVGQVDILYGGGLARHFIEDEKGPGYMADMKKLLDEVNEEDRIGVERVFRGLNAPLARPGHLSYLERPNYEFGQYLARQMTRAGT
jgi:phenylpropionate dioxygenase-like ring-hydroxylating dioxygenase large terminal subunit